MTTVYKHYLTCTIVYYQLPLFKLTEVHLCWYTFYWTPISVGIGPQQGKIEINVVGLIVIKKHKIDKNIVKLLSSFEVVWYPEESCIVYPRDQTLRNITF